MKQLIIEDMLYDGKSLVCRNGIVEAVEDPLDSNRIPEGRLGEFQTERIKTRMGAVLYLPITRTSRNLASAAAEEDSETRYLRAASDRYLMLEKTDASGAAALAEGMDGDGNLVPWEPEEQKDGMRQWAGWLETESAEPMLGIIRLISARDGSVYVLRYGGIGNFTDIRMEEQEILRPLYRRLTR